MRADLRCTAILERRQLELHTIDSVDAVDEENEDEDEGDLPDGLARQTQRRGSTDLQPIL
jgi:hypothetical protein